MGKALCNGHSTAVGLKDPRVALVKCNDAFRQNTFCWVHVVLNTNTAYILLISDDMTVSVRSMKRHPERCWQKYWCSIIILATLSFLLAYKN